MTAQIGSAVPITSQTAPGSTTPAPSVAAISSPQPQTTSTSAGSPVASRSHGAIVFSTPCGGTIGASRDVSMPNASQMPSCHWRVRTSTSIEWTAFDASTPYVPDAASATNDPGSRNRAVRPKTSGSCSRIQAIFAPTCPPSRLQPLVAYSWSGSTRSAIAPQTRRRAGPSR